LKTSKKVETNRFAKFLFQSIITNKRQEMDCSFLLGNDTIND